jgi:sialic acid synthase SpsE
MHELVRKDIWNQSKKILWKVRIALKKLAAHEFVCEPDAKMATDKGWKTIRDISAGNYLSFHNIKIKRPAGVQKAMNHWLFPIWYLQELGIILTLFDMETKN